MNHWTHHCLVPFAEPHICCAKAPGKFGQPRRRCACYTRRSLLPLLPMPWLTIFIQVARGWEYILSIGPATGKVGCDCSIEMIGSREWYLLLFYGSSLFLFYLLNCLYLAPQVVFPLFGFLLIHRRGADRIAVLVLEHQLGSTHQT